ncbi:MAG: hypothetical protein J1F63_08285 [Oscillospiraceae bacterium]|nr:hypothetical protein [Oscillospiraceae bacterium]
MKKLMILALALCLLLPSAAALAEGEDIKVYLDGKLIALTDANGDPVTPVVIDGTTYLPVRAISNALDLNVSWNDNTRSVYLSSGKGSTIIATDMTGFSNLSRYVNDAYELLGRSVFLNPLKELMGADYDKYLIPMLSTCYAEGDNDMLTLYGSVDGNNSVAIDIYPNGRIDVALKAAVDAGSSDGPKYRNVIKYYSNELFDAIDSPGVLKFIAENIASHKTIEFCRGTGEAKLKESTYKDVNGFGSFKFTPKDDGRFAFSGGITGSPNGGCTSSGTISLQYGCTVCMENGAPSILFAFSGDSLTVIGLNSVTKPLTTVYVKE